MQTEKRQHAAGMIEYLLAAPYRHRLSKISPCNSHPLPFCHS